MAVSRKAQANAFDRQRRDFLGMLACTGLGAGVPFPGDAMADSDRHSETRAPAPAGEQELTLRVNGREHRLSLEPRVTLLDALRGHLGLTGAKKGCDRGQCGACTVLVDGRRINSCLTLALMHDGEEITTVEGLGAPGQPAALQSAFLEHDAFQCGFCTPGQLCAASALLDELRANRLSAVTPRDGKVEPSAAEIRERMSGNLCRCGAYSNIVAAVRAAYRS